MEGLIEFSTTINITRGHSKKIILQRCNKSIRQNTLFIRAVSRWNSLTEEMVNAKTVVQFKTLYDRHFDHEKYDTNNIYNI